MYSVKQLKTVHIQYTLLFCTTQNTFTTFIPDPPFRSTRVKHDINVEFFFPFSVNYSFKSSFTIIPQAVKLNGFITYRVAVHAKSAST